MFEGLLDRFWGDLMKDDALKPQGAKIRGFEQVPGDRFALTVRVSCQVDVARFLSRVADLLDGACLFLRYHVLGEEAVIDLDTEITLWEVSDVPDGSFDVVIGAEDARDCSSFRRRLDDDEALIVLRRQRHVPSATRARATAGD